MPETMESREPDTRKFVNGQPTEVPETAPEATDNVVVPDEAEDLDGGEKVANLETTEEREKSQGVESNLPMHERFRLQREKLVKHYLEAYRQLEDASRDPIEVRKAIDEYIGDHGLFEPTPEEKRAYKDPALAEDALERTLERYKREAREEVTEELRRAGKLPPELPR